VPLSACGAGRAPVTGNVSQSTVVRVKNREYTHPALDEFAAVAATFCNIIENTESVPASERLKALHTLLPRIYLAALDLETTSVLFDEDASDAEEESGSSQGRVETPAALNDLADYLGSRRFYREIFDPYSEPSDGEVVGDLIDDFTDIYRDVRGGLVEWEHATSALRALFALSAWRDEEWPAG